MTTPVDEPACWSWPVPPLRDLDAELRLLAAAYAALPPDLRIGGSALGLLYGSAAAIRWQEYHAGVRLPDAVHAPWRCAMCARSDTAGGYRLVTDHDHATGRVRGVLCSSCNIIEGIGARDVAHAYRGRNPASILGHRQYYVGRGWPLGWWTVPARARRLTGDPGWEPVL